MDHTIYGIILDVCDLNDEQIEDVNVLIQHWFRQGSNAQYIPKQGKLFMVWRNSKVLGIALMQDSKIHQVHYLMSLCVDPLQRGQGIGSLMLSQIREYGYKTMLYVDKGEGHDRLLKWYRHCGYDVVGMATHVPLNEEVETLLVSTNTPMSEIVEF